MNELQRIDAAAAKARQLQQYDQAAQLYADAVKRWPDNTNLHYNFAYHARLAGWYTQAVESYRQALAMGISEPEEVANNIAVIYSDHLLQPDQALIALEQALKLNPNYLPALHNMAHWHEEAGNKQQAEHYFREVIKREPGHAGAHARLADVCTVASSNDPLIAALQRFAQAPQLDLNTRADVCYGLGKLLNGCGAYDKAWQAYQQANELNKQLLPAWDAEGFAELVAQLKQQLTPEWLATQQSHADFAPVFVCGMFRSGSTLAEQILAAHPQVTAGGELDFFARQWQPVLAQSRSVAEVMASFTPDHTADLAIRYQQFVAERFGSQLLQQQEQPIYLTDKRPDNFLLLGFIKAVFPKAKIIHTTRNPLDNCLSVYFTRLGKLMGYANDIEHTAEYLAQQNELMAHWQQLFGDSMFTLHYDDLIADTECSVGDLLAFLDLPWNDNCLAFHKLRNQVKTASVWQVRQPLYSSSCGRWKNYREQLPASVKQRFGEN